MSRFYIIFLFLFAILIIPNSGSDSDLCVCRPYPTYDQYGNNMTAFGAPSQQIGIIANGSSCCDYITIFCSLEARCPYSAAWANRTCGVRNYTYNFQFLMYGQEQITSQGVSAQHGPQEAVYNLWISTSCTLYSGYTNLNIICCLYENVLAGTDSNDTVKACIDDNGGNSSYVVELAESPYGFQALLLAKNMTDQFVDRLGTPWFVVNDIRKEDNTEDNNACGNADWDYLNEMYNVNSSKAECRNS